MEHAHLIPSFSANNARFRYQKAANNSIYLPTSCNRHCNFARNDTKIGSNPRPHIVTNFIDDDWHRPTCPTLLSMDVFGGTMRIFTR